MSKTALAALLILLVIGFASAAAILQLTNTGTIHVNSPYLTASTTRLEWGIIPPGAIAQRTVAFTNTGDKATAPLNMTATAVTVGSFTWNLEGAVLQPNQTETATFTLQVTEDAGEGDFQFTATITG